MTRRYKVLTDEQVDHFLQHGFIHLPQAFTPAQADEWTRDMWVRLGMDPHDQSTWTREWTNMPHHKTELVSKFAPTAWDAICDLVGGAERIDDDKRSWSDGFIVNLGSEEFPPERTTHPTELKRWHCDGDFFLHFLDSPEQGLLVVPLFSDVVPNGGGTIIAPEGVGHIARYLAAHPEGVMPTAFPFHDIAVNQCKNYVELTGKKGDVILLHPLMLHTASRNHLRAVRVITNPPISLTEPFKFKRSSSEDYSLVELKTMRELGADASEGYDFKLVGERKEVVPLRLQIQAKWKAEELERMRVLKENGQKRGKQTLDEAWEAIGY
ncbi:hypothetical protein BD324DRAFT_636193 [Kockovaella imperatae]|uniref:Phytanoyl-CoA dioxygenase n=1 Tax=Kockovaella imperatae TaxID=4999 RepID=A0A1Y1U8Z2_9TREE|nr:hypothetical protein BD324DRAFT_636193 [Kockovaella imperatae]ORX34511.1 hypothetical protein BD324DRAFT_636193 [Kockovaella imperatae]